MSGSVMLDQVRSSLFRFNLVRSG